MPYRPTERTRTRQAATRERLLGAAEDLLAERGYAGTGVAAVARAAEVATGTVYRHFGGREELLGEVYRRRSERELALAAGAMGDRSRPAAERLAAAVEAFARRALAGPVLASAMIAEPVDAAVEEERLAFRRGYRDLLARVLEDGIAAGELPPQDAETSAACLVGAIGEALVGPLAARDGDGETVVAALVSLCLRAVGG